MDPGQTRFEARVEALLEQFDKRMSSVEARLMGVEDRLDGKASSTHLTVATSIVVAWVTIARGVLLALLK
jgi:hypothetical protein